MTQSVCSRCLKPLSEADKRRHTILCNLCEPVWQLAFEGSMMEYAAAHHDLLPPQPPGGEVNALHENSCHSDAP